jgi:predicted MFS family arabinose efflux permease
MAGLVGAVLIARLPVGINGLALVLFLREETGSFSVPGAVAGSMALGIGLGAPVMGRVVDRLGPRILLPVAVGNACGVLGLLALGSSGAPTWPLVALGAATGALFPPNPSVLRARLPGLLRDAPELVQPAYALDSVLLELSFVLSPLLVALMVATTGPAAALVVSAAAVVLGTVAFVGALPTEATAERDAADASLLGALRAPAVRTLVLTMLPVGFALGALEVAVPAFSREEGHAETAGLLLALWALASAVGGFVYGARPRRAPLTRVHLQVTLALPLAFLPLALADSVAAMALLLIPAGAFIAPMVATRNELASITAPRGSETETLTWPLTAMLGGISMGAAAAGNLIDGSSWRAAVLAAVGGAAAAGLVAVARRESLRSATAPA